MVRIVYPLVLICSLCLIYELVPFFLMSPTTTENDKENTDPLAESPTVTPKVLKTKLKVPSASTKTVWKSNDDAVLIATLLKEQEEGPLQGSEKTSGGVAKTSGSYHDHWGKLKKDFTVIKKLREQFGLLIVLDLECKRGICIRELYIGIIEIIRFSKLACVMKAMLDQLMEKDLKYIVGGGQPEARSTIVGQ
ncbi:hypothetical protein F4604DRAFT_1954218 [Suillus subluteus]|nr:hypothetical protein F4604DRAFT_1954218 [Suillus subluteus]